MLAANRPLRGITAVIPRSGGLVAMAGVQAPQGQMQQQPHASKPTAMMRVDEVVAMHVAMTRVVDVGAREEDATSPHAMAIPKLAVLRC